MPSPLPPRCRRGSRRRRPTVGLAAVLALVATACGAGRPAVVAPSAAQEEVARRPPLPLVRNPRFFVLPGERQLPGTEVDPDGTRRVLVQGMRLVIHPDGSLERGEELLPYGNVVAVALPERLGKGFLFHAQSAGDTLLWRAATWTGTLTPLGRVGFQVQAIVAGFDRLLLHVAGSNEVVALDPTDGKLLEDGGLPPAPGARFLAFVDAWTGVVDVPLRGTLATFDAGVTWHSLELGGSNGLEVVDDRVIIHHTERDYTLDASGHLMAGEAYAATSYAGEPTPEAAPAPPWLPPPGPLGREPLRAAVLHGWPDSATTAVVATGGNLGRVRLTDGKVLAATKHAFPPSDECHAVPLGGGFGFVCGSEHGTTVIYAFEPPLSLRPVLSFEHPRYVASSGNGALVVRGACTPGGGDQSSRYCIITPTGVLREIRVRGDRGVERVVALHDGRTAVIVPPRLGAPGQVTVVDAAGGMKNAKLKLPKEPSKRSLVRNGLWLEGFVETQTGELAGWVAAGGPFAGVKVALDGKVTVGHVEGEVERALLSGRVGLVLARSGLAAETTDGGATWQELETPVDLEGAEDPRQPRGCSRVGCTGGNWVRIGWGSKQGKADPLTEVQVPKPTILPSSGGGRWLIDCAPTTEVARPAVAVAPAWSPSGEEYAYGGVPMLSADSVRGTGFTAFQGLAAPAKAASDVGLDNDTRYLDAELHAYAWGGRTADWSRAGHFVIRGSDPFAIRGFVWSTSVTRSPWLDLVQAARAFGHNGYGAPSPNWSVSSEPSFRGGALFMAQDTGPELYIFEENRSVATVRFASVLGLFGAAGVVKARGRWYLGVAGETFRVYEVVGDDLEVRGDYPVLANDGSQGAVQTTVVRNDAGDALALWVRANRTRGSETEWFVYPIDVESGRISDPLVLTGAALGKMPPACGDGDTGWVLVGAPPVAPFIDVAGEVAAPRDLQVRFLAGAHGLCVDALSAQTDVPIPARPSAAPADWARNRVTVPMVVANRAYDGHRWLFRCAG